MDEKPYEKFDGKNSNIIYLTQEQFLSPQKTFEEMKKKKEEPSRRYLILLKI